LTDDFFYLTPYQYASCEPIANIDLDGLEGQLVTVPGRMSVSITSSTAVAFTTGTAIATITAISVMSKTIINNVTRLILNIAGRLAMKIMVGVLDNNTLCEGTNHVGDPTKGEKLEICDDGFVNSYRIKQYRIAKSEQKDVKSFKAIILHRTVSSTVNSTFTEFKKTGKGVHFVIDKDGTIYQVVSLKKYTRHLWEGKQKKHAKSIKNSNTIGIEHVGMYHDKTKTWDEVTPEMEKSSAWLVNSLMITFQLSTTDVMNHENVCNEKTACEGGDVQDAILPHLDDPTKQAPKWSTPWFFPDEGMPIRPRFNPFIFRLNY